MDENDPAPCFQASRSAVLAAQPPVNNVSGSKTTTSDWAQICTQHGRGYVLQFLRIR